MLPLQESIQKATNREECAYPLMDESLFQIREWIQKCTNSHLYCETISSFPKHSLPTRVIDVGSSDGSEEPHLYVPHEEHQYYAASYPASDFGPEWRYIALSYCWGQSSNFTTTLSTLEARQRSISVNQLPRTIRDAIYLTRKLGIRFLWVDALCILQGSGHDWSRECGKMADIYGQAFLTIAAAEGSDAHSGICISPKQWHGPDRDVLISQVRSKYFNGRDREYRRSRILEKSPLYKRAWTLQERILSPRVIIFGTDQMYWECQSDRDGEIGVKSSGWVSFRLPLVLNQKCWHRIVEDYACREMAFAMDKLPALSGLAQRFHQATRCTYVAGIWKESLLEDLVWKEDHLVYGNRIETKGEFGYRAPSWSWASIDGNIYFPDTKAIDAASILDCVTIPEGDDPFGQVSGGWIKIRCPVKHATTISENHLHDKKSGLESVAAVWLDTRGSSNAVTSPGHSWEPSSGFTCLLICQAEGLILTPVVIDSQIMYKRVGMFYLRNEEWLPESSWRKLLKTVMIV